MTLVVVYLDLDAEILESVVRCHFFRILLKLKKLFKNNVFRVGEGGKVRIGHTWKIYDKELDTNFL